MKKLLLFLLTSIIFFSCKKDDTEKCPYTNPVIIAPASEVDSLQNWLTSQGISAVRDNSGLFYKIDSSGAGASPQVCKTFVATYSGTFLDGGVFDSNSSGTTFLLGQLVAGWQIGLPKIKSGGGITLYVPPSLGYGDRAQLDQNGSVRIPANSYLIFYIHLIAVN